MIAPGEVTSAGRRALRVLLVANDGFSAGHVARIVAIARGLTRRAEARDIGLRLLMATTSEARALFADEPMAVVTLPTPLAARRAGFSDRERRHLVRGSVAGVAEAFGPDLIVVDTFPSGPHGELVGLGAHRAKRALIRRSVPEERAGETTLSAGLTDYHLAVVANDPIAVETTLPIPVVRVPPITMTEAKAGLTREDARAQLGLPAQGGILLIAAGGGGDQPGRALATSLAEAVTRVAPDVITVLARGPLAIEPSETGSRVRSVTMVPLAPYLAAFDGAISAAGYNTAHELAKARVPMALFAQARPFDDQAARAMRFAKASLAHALLRIDDDAVADALAWMTSAPRPPVEAGGADRAADALLDLVTRAAGSR